jgi:hypothetical protein
MTGFVEPVTLIGERWVSLEPLSRDHVPEIAAASADGDVGSLWFTGAPSPQTASQWVDMRLGVQTPDTGLTFVVRRLDGTVVGSSSYLNVDRPTGDSRSATPGTAHPRGAPVSTPRPSC